MKLNKIDFTGMMQKMMNAYNVFITEETLRDKADAYFDKLKWQESHIVKKVMEGWEGAKMPNASEILTKCKGSAARVSENTPLAPHETICRYGDYGDTEECATSRYLCANGSDNFPIDAARVNFCLGHRPDKKIICYWHQQVILGKQRRKFDKSPLPTWTEMMIDMTNLPKPTAGRDLRVSDVFRTVEPQVASNDVGELVKLDVLGGFSC